MRDHNLKKYGITQADYEELRRQQNECCAICHRHETNVPRSNYKKKDGSTTCLHVDHCHATGQVRGLLCFNCNALLGKCRPDTTILEEAINYLRTKDERKTKVA